MNEKEEITLFVSGRLCLLGEHSDWAAEYAHHKGFCLVTGTDQGLTAVAKPSTEFRVTSPVPNGLGRPSARRCQMSCEWNAQTLLETARDEDEFFRYCAGVAYQIASRFGISRGMDLNITSMDLPLKKGVSSSAAACILVADAFDRLYNLGLFPHELMEIAYLGEKLTGSQCGCMDQACIYGSTPVLLTFEKSSDVRIEPVFPGADIQMFFVDLAGQKDTVKILKSLQEAYSSSTALQEALGAENERIVRAGFRALREGSAKELGRLMTHSQELFDRKVAPLCRDQLQSPLLHKLLNLPELRPHVYGGKGVGSQGDGTAQFVARSAQDREQAMKVILANLPKMQCFSLTIKRAVQSQESPPMAA